MFTKATSHRIARCHSMHMHKERQWREDSHRSAIAVRCFRYFCGCWCRDVDFYRRGINTEGGRGEILKQWHTCVLSVCLTVLFHPWQRHSNLLKERLDIMSSFCGCLHEHDIKLRWFCGCFFESHLSIEVPNRISEWRSCRRSITDRLSERSALFPTRTIITSFPLSERTSSIHFDVDMKDWRSEICYCQRTIS